MNDLRLQTLIENVRGRYENNGDPAHDFIHIQRVMASCRRIGEIVKADLSVLLPAALLHDVINIPKNHPDRLQASARAAEEAAGLLIAAGYSAEEVARIQVIITEHSYSLGRKPSTIESAVMQDADRLDAIGAIGLMRMITCGAQMRRPFYHPEEPVPEVRPRDDQKYTIDHLYVKLFKLLDGFNTEPAKIEGQARVQFMRDFVAQLTSEI